MRAPAPGSERVLADLVARIASQLLDRARPLWQLTVVEGLAGALSPQRTVAFGRARLSDVKAVGSAFGATGWA